MDFIKQILDGLAAQQQPSQIAFVNGMPIVNPQYKGPTVQKPQMVLPEPLQQKLDDIFAGLDYQDQWMQRMRLPLLNYAERRRNQP